MSYPVFCAGRKPAFRNSTRALFTALVCAAPAGFASGQLPLVMDNPGTVEQRHWEFDAGWSVARADGVSAHDLPALGVIYGLGPTVDLAYAVGWTGASGGGNSEWALGDSSFTLKWRFHDGGEHGCCASVTPILGFRTPGSKAVARGLSDGGVSLGLPFQLQRCCGPIAYSFDFGPTHCSRGADDWSGGIAVSGDVANGVELGGEVRATTDAHFGAGVVTLYAEGAVAVTEDCALLVALGRDVVVPSGGSRAVSGYIGLRWSK